MTRELGQHQAALELRWAVERSNAATQRDRLLHRHLTREIRGELLQRPRRDFRGRGARIRQHQGEFVPRHAGCAGALGQGSLPQELGYTRDDGVTRLEARHLVHDMEAIDVDADHGMSARAGRGALVCRGGVLLQAQSRIEAGRRIEVGVEQRAEMTDQVPGDGQVEGGELRILRRAQEQQGAGIERRRLANGRQQQPEAASIEE